MMRFSSPLSFTLFVLVAASIPLPAPLAAAVITVDSTCTLAAAIAAANADAPVGGCPAGSGADTITLTSGVDLGSIDNSIDGANGLPSVTTTITVEGEGYLVSGDEGPSFRIFHVGQEGDLTLRNIGIFWGEAGESGGGGIFARGALTVEDSAIAWNRSEGAGRARGGGIFIAIGGQATVVDTVVLGNEAYAREADSRADSSGGGVYSEGTLRIRSSKVNFNSVISDLAPESHASGGGIACPRGSIDIRDSTVHGNLARADQVEGGGLYLNIENPLIVRSTISSNVADGGVYAMGGGVFSHNEESVLENATISGNDVISTDFTGGGGFAGKGHVRQSTFAGNEAAGRGAAIWTYGTVAVSGTLFSESIGDHCAGTVVDLGGNLADDDSCLPTIPGTLTGLDPTLADNGGPTLTHELSPESTAIDIAGDCGLATDQRGAARAGPCDSGAFEEIGCKILEIKDRTVTSDVAADACSTALLGPNLVVDSPHFWIHAPDLITIKDDVEVRAGVDFWLVNELP